MSGSRRGRLAAASYTGLALSVISAFAVPALAHAASASGPASEGTSPPDFNAGGLLPFGPPATMAVLPAATADPAPAPVPPPRAPAPVTTSTSAPGTVRALSAGVAYTATQPGDPPDSDFDRLAQCESGGRWSLDTGNGYYGGLQFSASTWHGYGGPDLPNQHSRDEQIEIARRVWRARGWSPWPSCSRQVGLR